MSESQTMERHPPPWIFGITNIPFGVSGNYALLAMPYILSKLGMPIGQIATLAAVALIPAAWQWVWAPILDLWIPRRYWLVLVSILGSLCLAVSLEVKLPEHLTLFEVLVVAGQALTGLVGSCNGALVSTTLPVELRDKAAGWVNAANLGAAIIGGGLVMTAVDFYSVHVAAVILLVTIIGPSLVALTIWEAPREPEPIGDHLIRMAKDVWAAVKSRRGWTGLLFCISPVGTVALGNLFPALGQDFHAPDQTVTWVTGYVGGFITAGGALASGYLLKFIDRRFAYLLSGILTALCAAAMALSPMTPTSYTVGVVIYMIITGLAYTAFSAVVYEIVGTATTTASTLYSLFPAVGNMAIVYTVFLDGHAHDATWHAGGAAQVWGARGILWCDAILNIIGVLALLLLLRVVFPEGSKADTPKPDSEPSAPCVNCGRIIPVMAGFCGHCGETAQRATHRSP